MFVSVLPSNARWVQQGHLLADDAQPIDLFGDCVAISGDTIVVGAYSDDTASGTEAGSAYVFTRTDETWSQQGHLFAADAQPGDWFGGSVAISGDTIVVGAGHDDVGMESEAGSAYVFTRTGVSWSQQDQIFADDGLAGDKFGSEVAISGDTIVVGALSDDSDVSGANIGSAYVFTRTGVSWSQQDHLFAADASAGDVFGSAVAIDGDTIVVGAKWDDTPGGTAAGSAYVFTRSGITWTQQDHITADDAAASDEFGYSVAISGETLVVGARSDDKDSATDSGSAYVFTRSGSSWSQQDHLFANDLDAGDRFGESVAISGDTVVVGAWQDSTEIGTTAGSAYVFTRTGSAWNQQDHLFADQDEAAPGDTFGNSVAISHGTIVVGTPHDKTAAGGQAGSAYVFLRRFLETFVGELPDLLARPS